MTTAHDVMTETPATVGPTSTVRSALELLHSLDATVATLMSSDVLSVEEEADLAEVVDLMLDHRSAPFR